MDINRKIVSLFIFSCISIGSYAQEISISSTSGGEQGVYAPERKINIDKSILLLQYRMTSVKDVKSPEKKRYNFMLLEIGNRVSKFSDYYMLKADSIEDALYRQKKSESEIVKQVQPYFMGRSPMNVFKNYPVNKITVTDRVFLTGDFKYEEDKSKPQWKMESGSTTVCGYKCRKASTVFRGRNYTAWYAPEIAFSDGPWKFWGLPGLILKIGDDKGEFLFECVAIQKALKNASIYIKDKDYFITTRKKFNEAAKRAFENPISIMENRGITVGKESIKKKKTLPFNPIELGD